MDPDADPDPPIFVSDLQDSTKNCVVFKSCLAYYVFFEGTFT
jgi:hypothetical protein